MLEFNLLYIVTSLIGLFVIYKFFFSSPTRPPTTQVESKKTEDEVVKGPKLLILYGSQTGTAEEYANTLGQEAKRYGFAPTVTDMVDVQGEDLAEKDNLVIFVLATYGEGEPTDNTRDFYEWLLSKDRELDTFSKLKYSVFGLGNKQVSNLENLTVLV